MAVSLDPSRKYELSQRQFTRVSLILTCLDEVKPFIQSDGPQYTGLVCNGLDSRKTMWCCKLYSCRRCQHICRSDDLVQIFKPTE